MGSTPGRYRHALWRTFSAVQLLLLVGMGTGLALWLKPEPHSDWLYYWYAAGKAGSYERGGLDLWLLAIPKALGAQPVVAALTLNLPTVAWLWYLAYRIDTGHWKMMAQLVVAYLILITPFYGIVQFDLIVAAQMATAFWLLLDRRLRLAGYWRYGLAAMAIAFAVSTRPQYALTLWVLVAMMVCGAWFSRFRVGPELPALVATLLVGSVAGFATDMGMRQFSGRTEQIRTSSAVTLYSGLLTSSETRHGACGYWTVEAAEAAKEDLSKSLSAAVRERLASQPLSHWLRVMLCKAPQVVSPPPFALYWLVESPNVHAAIDASPQRKSLNASYDRASRWERRIFRLLTASILLACIWTAAALWRKHGVLALLPGAWVVSFWLIHAVFEIQGRYFLGTLLVAPFICALLYRFRVDVVGEGQGLRAPMPADKPLP